MSFIARILRPAAPTRKHGELAEQLAADWLQRRGLHVIERNFRVRGGEIDLICREGDVTVFVEVRLRQHAGYGGAGASITPHKQRRLVLAAQHWLQRHGEGLCRFDCILLDSLERPTPEWIRDAFAAE